MEFELNDTQRMVRDMARSYAERVLKPQAAAFEAAEKIPREVLTEMAGLGLMGVNVPGELNGTGAGAVAYSLAMMEVARGCASTAVTMAVSNMVAEVVTQFGTDAQRERYVPRLVTGELVAGSFALSEPEAGSDPGSMRTVAERKGAGWSLRGTKQWITSGEFAGLFIVWARTGGPGTAGLSAFLVERDAPGLRVGRKEDKMGLRASSTVALHFDGVEVGPEQLLGEEGGGFRIAMMALDGGRIGIGSQACGVATAALEEMSAYARERRQFGRSISDFQAIQWMVADSRTELEAARLLVLRAASLKERGQNFSREAAMGKVFATESAWRICDRNVQVHGGYGYVRDFPAERHLRDIRVSRIYEGTSEIQRTVIARQVLRG